MSVSYGMTPFDKLQWGDPALAQIAGTDAQAYADYPASDVLTSMSTGPEQAPKTAFEKLSGGLNDSGVGTQTDNAASAPCNNNAWWFLNPSCYQYINPLNGGNWTGANQKSGASGGGVDIMGAKDWQHLVTYAVIGLLAIGLVLLGVKQVAEA